VFWNRQIVSPARRRRWCSGNRQIVSPARAEE